MHYGNGCSIEYYDLYGPPERVGPKYIQATERERIEAASVIGKDTTEEQLQQQTRDEISDQLITTMLSTTGQSLTGAQIQALKSSLQLSLSKYNVEKDNNTAEITTAQEENARVLRMFLDAKKVEGRSQSTLYNYAKEIVKLFMTLNKSYKYITTKDLREYLAYRKDLGLTNVTIRNIRLYLNSFFKWSWKEELIPRNPMDRIGVIKTENHVIKFLSEEEREIIRSAADTERDKAIIEILTSTGMRVSECCGLNIEDVDFEKGEVKVFGKGSKERICYLNGPAKVHLRWYLRERKDQNPALFVTVNEPHTRLTKNGIAYILKRIAAKSEDKNIHLHAHLYRSTLATSMINKGASVDIVQKILGHSNPNVTMQCYANISNETLKMAHHKYA